MRDIKDEITFLKKLEKLSLDQAVTHVSESVTKLFIGQAEKLRYKIRELELGLTKGQTKLPKKKKKGKKK